MQPPGETSFLCACMRGDRDFVRTAIRTLNESHGWDHLFAVAADEAVLPAVAGWLRALTLTDALPAGVAAFLSAVEASNGERNGAIETQLRTAVAALNEAGIEPVLLKGLACLFTDVYPDPAARYILDIDLLLPPADLVAASVALKRNGFIADEDDPFRHYRHHMPPLRRPGGVWIELHGQLGSAPCEALLPAADVIAASLPLNLDGLRARVPCPDHMMVHLILHSQLQHAYNERIWPPLRAMYDLVLLRRRFRTELNWQAVAAPFRRSGQFHIVALHLLQIRASLGQSLPFSIPKRPGILLRWYRRSFLRQHPSLRYLDPVYMFSTVVRRRLAMLRRVRKTPGGLRHLLQQTLASDNYARVWSDFTEGRGR